MCAANLMGAPPIGLGRPVEGQIHLHQNTVLKVQLQTPEFGMNVYCGLDFSHDVTPYFQGIILENSNKYRQAAFFTQNKAKKHGRFTVK